MTIFDQYFYNVFNHYKPRLKQKASNVATVYISLLQSVLCFVLGAFFAAFFSNMHVDSMSSTKAWTLFIICCILIYFKNWIQYSGKKRKVLNAKTMGKIPNRNIWFLWSLPIIGLILGIIILQAL